ncbi:pyridoxal 5'-phosphate synthase [Aeromicrobium sp. UC242_57]|uniref:pyridoxal 5'-phosphate synthase n=1 Tax=Aeromicrobium sp. UC242_57 TaxID=3374624 RepID=UPI00378CCD0C
METPDLARMREDYSRAGLDESAAGDDPLSLFARWLDDAVDADVHEPNAMALATATPDGRPSVRIVLLKGFDARGLTFFTGYESRKGRGSLPIRSRRRRCCGTRCSVRCGSRAPWCGSTRPSQMRTSPHVRGDRRSVPSRRRSRVPSSGGRPWSSGWPRSSETSRVVTSSGRRRGVGYRISVESIEFWQGRTSRLHDRILFTRDGVGATWSRVRLAP